MAALFRDMDILAYPVRLFLSWALYNIDRFRLKAFKA